MLVLFDFKKSEFHFKKWNSLYLTLISTKFILKSLHFVLICCNNLLLILSIITIPRMSFAEIISTLIMFEPFWFFHQKTYWPTYKSYFAHCLLSKFCLILKIYNMLYLNLHIFYLFSTLIQWIILNVCQLTQIFIKILTSCLKLFF